MTGNSKIFLEWVAELAKTKPKGNALIDSPRGMEVCRLVTNFERNNFNWLREDEDTFWISIQLYVYYGLSDDEILFTLRQQPGIENYKKHAAERNAYNEMMRGIKKLMKINGFEQLKKNDDGSLSYYQSSGNNDERKDDA